MNSKAKLRQELLMLRKQLSKQQCEQAAKAVCDAVVNYAVFKAATKLAFYYPINSELDTQLLMRTALQQGKQCFLPVLHEQTWRKQTWQTQHKQLELQQEPSNSLLFLPYELSTKLVPNKYGILEPQVEQLSQAAAKLQDLSIIFLPLVGFDAKGNRLGMGAGYYDIALAELIETKAHHSPLLLGLAYAMQEVQGLIPAEDTDVLLDGVVTEAGVRFF